ncbi:MAG: hypothetical protein KF901_20980 [Myxococcales bacterium]|nr:hypothetical protein [Myxococcales bacterium]
MGFDTSHHPVDDGVVARLTEYIVGRGSIDDLVAEAVRLEKVRFRANAWGLGVSKLRREGRFDPFLHVWGRPFFVTVEGDAVGEAIDRYLDARTDAEVDAIAKEMLRALDPALADEVEPSNEGSLPDDEALAIGLRASLDLIRAAWAAPRGGTVVVPSGEAVPAEELLWREVPLTVLTFAAHLRPGWMDRGYVWPTVLLGEAGVETSLFETPEPLLGPLLDRVDQRFFLHTTILENYMVGGYVAAAKVPALRALLEEHQETLVAVHDGPSAEMQLSVAKLLEAVRDAERRGLAFAEATEVYSGFSGIMN